MRLAVFFLCFFLIFACSSVSVASGPKETDLIIRVKKAGSGVGTKKKIVKKKKTVQNTLEIYNVEVENKSKTGTISVTGRSGEIFTQGSGKNVDVKSKIGGVKVGTK